MCTLLLPPGDNPIAVNKCILLYQIFIWDPDDGTDRDLLKSHSYFGLCLSSASGHHSPLNFQDTVHGNKRKTAMDNNRSQEHSNKIIELWWPAIQNKSFDRIRQIRSCLLTEDGSKADLRNIVLL